MWKRCCQFYNYSNYFTLKDGEAGTLQLVLAAWIPGPQNLHWPRKALPALCCTECAQSCKRRAENGRMYLEQSRAHELNPPWRVNCGQTGVGTAGGGFCCLLSSLQWVSPSARRKIFINPSGSCDPGARALPRSCCYSHCEILCKKLCGACCVRPQSHGDGDRELMTCRGACTIRLYNR